MNLTDFHYDNLANDVANLKLSIANKLIYTVGKDPVTALPQDWLQATALAVRDRLVDRWMKTTRAQYKQDVKRVYYLSMEFLIGRTFTNAMLALGIYQDVRQALAEMEVDFDKLADL